MMHAVRQLSISLNYTYVMVMSCTKLGLSVLAIISVRPISCHGASGVDRDFTTTKGSLRPAAEGSMFCSPLQEMLSCTLLLRLLLATIYKDAHSMSKPLTRMQTRRKSGLIEQTAAAG
jgi:hypothetical protein